MICKKSASKRSVGFVTAKIKDMRSLSSILSGTGALLGALIVTFVTARVVHQHTRRSKGFDAVIAFNKRYQDLLDGRSEDLGKSTDRKNNYTWWRHYFDLLQNEFFWSVNGLIPTDIFKFWVKWQVRAYHGHQDTSLIVRNVTYKRAWEWWSKRELIKDTTFVQIMKCAFEMIEDVDGKVTYHDDKIDTLVDRVIPRRRSWNALKGIPLVGGMTISSRRRWFPQRCLATQARYSVGQVVSDGVGTSVQGGVGDLSKGPYLIIGGLLVLAAGYWSFAVSTQGVASKYVCYMKSSSPAFTTCIQTNRSYAVLFWLMAILEFLAARVVRQVSKGERPLPSFNERFVGFVIPNAIAMTVGLSLYLGVEMLIGRDGGRTPWLPLAILSVMMVAMGVAALLEAFCHRKALSRYCFLESTLISVVIIAVLFVRRWVGWSLGGIDTTFVFVGAVTGLVNWMFRRDPEIVISSEPN